jgi:hypothetical protein
MPPGAVHINVIDSDTGILELGPITFHNSFASEEIYDILDLMATANGHFRLIDKNFNRVVFRRLTGQKEFYHMQNGETILWSKVQQRVLRANR